MLLQSDIVGVSSRGRKFENAYGDYALHTRFLQADISRIDYEADTGECLCCGIRVSCRVDIVRGDNDGVLFLLAEKEVMRGDLRVSDTLSLGIVGGWLLGCGCSCR